MYVVLITTEKLCFSINLRLSSTAVKCSPHVGEVAGSKFQAFVWTKAPDSSVIGILTNGTLRNSQP